MGGQIDGSLLPILADIYGVEDIEMLFRHLIVIRNHRQRNPGRG